MFSQQSHRYLQFNQAAWAVKAASLRGMRLFLRLMVGKEIKMTTKFMQDVNIKLVKKGRKYWSCIQHWKGRGGIERDYEVKMLIYPSSHGRRQLGRQQRLSR